MKTMLFILMFTGGASWALVWYTSPVSHLTPQCWEEQSEQDCPIGIKFCRWDHTAQECQCECWA